MTDNELADYLWNKLNILGESQIKFTELHKLVIEMRADLENVKQAQLLRIRLFELWKSFNKYTHTAQNDKIMFKPDELYQSELATIISKAIDHFESARN